jgi:hypothetical protein
MLGPPGLYRIGRAALVAAHPGGRGAAVRTPLRSRVFIFTGKGTDSRRAKEILAARFGERVR